MNEKYLLETDKLLLRQITSTDWDLFYSLQTNESVQNFVSDIKNDETIRQAFDSRLPIWNKLNPQWLCLVIILRETGERIGLTGFFPEWEPHQQAEVGFMLLPEFHGKGYGKESLIAVLEFAFRDCSFHKAKATVTEGNTASCCLLNKVGFQQEGIIRDNYKIGGTWKNDIVFGMFSNELITT
ncbi:GNAT family N-acetyltransferase [Spongorhabdus nitratireducens]